MITSFRSLLDKKATYPVWPAVDNPAAFHQHPLEGSLVRPGGSLVPPGDTPEVEPGNNLDWPRDMAVENIAPENLQGNNKE